MNKYIFPGADASCSLGWVVTQLESAGFEVKNIDVLGVHYSATIYRWYKNWLSNKDKVIEKYGERWYRIWVFFLAYSVITSRCVFEFFVGFIADWLVDLGKEGLGCSNSRFTRT